MDAELQQRLDMNTNGAEYKKQKTRIVIFFLFDQNLTYMIFPFLHCSLDMPVVYSMPYVAATAVFLIKRVPEKKNTGKNAGGYFRS
jgi:hypothetical protein